MDVKEGLLSCQNPGGLQSSTLIFQGVDVFY